jgi:DNA repair exonuclease SbcCD nuclease subunit
MKKPSVVRFSMPEIRFLTSSDEHLADLNPSARIDDYRAEILGMLKWQGELAHKFKAHAVLRGGDFFHVKAANKTTMRTIAESAKIHKRYPCPTYTIVGNHDMSHNDIDSVSGQPLGVLLKSEVFKPLRDEVFEDGSMKVRVTGVDYTTDIDVDGIHDLVRRKDENFSISVVHALAAMAPPEKIQAFFNERIFDYRDLVFNGCPDAYVFGHYHKDQGIQSHIGIEFVNLGSISRGSLTFENLERKPKVSLIKITPNGISIEEVIVPHRDAKEIFNLELKAKIEKERHSLNDFIQTLKETSTFSKDDSLSGRLSELDNFPDDIRKTALEIIQSAEEMEGLTG